MSSPQVSLDDRFLFDLQGFLVLRGVLPLQQCQALLQVVEQLKGCEFDDSWMAGAPAGATPTYDRRTPGHVRFNGLPRLDPVFDAIIDQPQVLPYLEAFMGQPQLVNTWCIEKSAGADTGVWHRGMRPTEYSYRDGLIRSRMLNVIYFLTDNGPDDGCVVAVPGAHKSCFDLPWHDYRGLELPGSQAVTGKAGDVLLFTETLLHNGLPKTTAGRRTNLYYNYGMPDLSVLYDPANLRHYCLPPEVRERFTASQKAVTQWMEYGRSPA